MTRKPVTANSLHSLKGIINNLKLNIMYKKVNMVMLPTNEKAKIGYLSAKGEEFKDLRVFDREMPIILDSKNFHLYITSNDKIKEGDWYLHISFDVTDKEYKTLNQCHKPHRKQDDDWFVDGMYSNQCHKIIATTDSSLKTGQLCGTCDNGTMVDSTKRFGTRDCGCITTLSQIPQQFIEHYVSEYNKGNCLKEIFVEYEKIE